MFKKKPINIGHMQKVKSRARRNLSSGLTMQVRNYVLDTSSIVNKFIPWLIRKGIKGKLIIPNAVMAELESQANKGYETGFIGLEEIVKLHKLKKEKKIVIYFEGPRPSEHQIKFAKSGEIDALIRESALKNKAILITSDLVQAKTAQAYGLEVIFLRQRQQKKPKKWLSSIFNSKK